MRFMMLMYPEITEQEWMPTAEAVAAMSRYNDELAKAGILLTLDGLHPPTEGARVQFRGGKAAVTDGPFAEAKEVVGGYWIIQVRDKAEAVAWASRCPVEEDATIEVRRIFELSDFPEDVQAAVQTAS